MSILLFALAISVLIIAHELGHFFAARRAGMKVEEFGIGFPPRVWGIRRGETLYSVNALPIGGFVRILGEDGSHRDNARSFSAKPILARMATIAAGVGVNVALAWLLFSITFMAGTLAPAGEGGAPNATNIGVQITDVAEGSPAQEAGVELGDRIVRIETEKDVFEGEELADIGQIIAGEAGQEIQLTLVRGSQERTEAVQVRQEAPEGEGLIGIAFTDVLVGTVSYPPHVALLLGAQVTVNAIVQLLAFLGDAIVGLLSAGTVPADITGPVGVASASGTYQQLGVAAYLTFLAIISLNLAVLNALPIPALDGGRFLFLLIEALKGSPVNKRYEAMVHTVGFVLLILLVVLITVRDIQNL